MSQLPCDPPIEDLSPPEDAVETVITPQPRDLGGFEVRRVLPSIVRRAVGPFVFLDQMGPATFDAGKGVDVRPHPHIGLATVTYLLKGSILHRDSLGTVQAITPGAVNLMTAGRGIVHSERTAPEVRQHSHPLFGLQLWVALPGSSEEAPPAFAHYAADAIPQGEEANVRVRVVAGEAFGLRSPVESAVPMFFFDIALGAQGAISLPANHAERALYLIEGHVAVGGVSHAPGQMLVLAPGREVVVRALEPARLVALGGEPLDGPRHLWWNFVSSSKDRIEQAKEDWRRNRFGLPVPQEHEFIPLPG